MLFFETVRGRQNILNSHVYTAIHDPAGYVWLGTDAGLLRYDGYSCIRMQLENPDHSLILSTSTIETLALQNDSSLWIGSSLGLLNMDIQTWKTKRSSLFKKSNVRALLVQNDSCIWVGTSQGLYMYDPTSEEAIYYSQINSRLSQNVIRSLYLDHSGNLWVGTADGLNVLQPGSSRFKTFDLKGDYKPEINHNLILDIKPLPASTDSILVIGTETGLVLFDRHKQTFRTYNQRNCGMSNEVVKTIHVKNPGEIFFGTDLGFNILNLENDHIESYFHDPFNQFSIVDNQIWKISPDERGDLWLATSNGISRLKRSHDFFTYLPVYFNHSGKSYGTKVSDITYDSSGNCWIGTSNGLVKLSESSESGNRQLMYLNNANFSINNINTISADVKNRIWIGSVAGVNIWDPARQKTYIPPMENRSSFRTASNYISSIVQGYDQFYWIGTWGGGLFKAWYSTEQMEDIHISYIADFNGYVVSGRDYLFALDNHAINVFNINTEKVEQFDRLQEQIGHTKISSIWVSALDVLWAGAKNQLLRYSVTADTIEVFPLPVSEDFVITGITGDDSGMIWACNHNTIFRYDPDSGSYKFFPISRNIPIRKFIPFPFRKTREGEILVCGYNGFISFDPGDLSMESEGNPVTITALKINGTYQQPSAFNKADLDLSFRKRNIELEFSSFAYDQIGQERYAYRLSGYDTDWKISEVGSNHVAYNQLPPGNYVFQIKSATADHQTEINSLPIKIGHPFWLQAPMLAAYALLLFLITGFIIFQFLRIRKERRNKGLIQAEKEKNELIYSSKTRFYVNISHELLNSIGLITYPLKKLLADKDLKDNGKKSLQLIEKNTYFLKAYVNQLLNFRTIELGKNMDRHEGKIDLTSFCKQVVKLHKHKAISKGILLKFKSEIKDIRISTDEEKLHAILQNLLSNAIFFTPPDGQVSLALRHCSGKEIAIEVRDTGIGIPEEEQELIFDRFYQVSNEHISNRGMGIGLTIVKDFVNILEGRIELLSRVGEGTSVKVFLPARNEDIQQLEDGAVTREYVNKDTIDNARKSVLHHLHESNGLPSVLVVDEDMEFFQHIQFHFMDTYRIYWASSGEEAIRFLNKTIPNFIVSEIKLQGMDGIAFCKHVRNKVNTSRIPFIFLTNLSDTEDQLKAIQAGVDVFLTKPCDLNVLEANISNLRRRVERTEEFISRSLILYSPKRNTGSKDDKLLKEVVDYIHQNLTNSQMTAKEISYSLGISHSNLYRRIKHSTGLSLNEFVRHIRLQNAERLLASGKLSVSEVMFEVGFTNHSYFSKCFKQQYKTTPKNYSRQHA